MAHIFRAQAAKHASVILTPRPKACSAALLPSASSSTALSLSCLCNHSNPINSRFIHSASSLHHDFERQRSSSSRSPAFSSDRRPARSGSKDGYRRNSRNRDDNDEWGGAGTAAQKQQQQQQQAVQSNPIRILPNARIESDEFLVGEPKCPGCGAILHSNEHSRPGYVPQDAVEAYLNQMDKFATVDSEEIEHIDMLDAEISVAAEEKVNSPEPSKEEEEPAAAAVEPIQPNIDEVSVEPVVQNDWAASIPGAVDLPDGYVEVVGTQKSFKRTHREALKQRERALAQQQSAEEDAQSDEVFEDMPDVGKADTHLLQCQRCFQLRHYGLAAETTLTADDFAEKLKRLKNSNVLLVKLVDVLDVEGSFVPSFRELVGEKSPVLLVGNKMDLLPDGSNMMRVKHWLKAAAIRHGLKDIRDVVLVSAATGNGINELGQAIETLRAGRDVYIVGCTNVGKSSLINQLLKKFIATSEKEQVAEQKQPKKEDGAEEGDPAEIAADEIMNGVNKKVMKKRSVEEEYTIARSLLTTSTLPGTTLNAVSFRLHDKKHLFDTPGVVNPAQPCNFPALKSPSEWPYLFPRKKLRPAAHKLREGKTLFLGALVRMDVLRVSSSSPLPYSQSRSQNILSGGAYSVSFVSQPVTLHVTSTERADEVWNAHAGTPLLQPPHGGPEVAQQLGAPQPLKRVLVRGRGRKTGSLDLAFPGYGWICISADEDTEVELLISAVQGMELTIREPMMPFELQTMKKYEISK